MSSIADIFTPEGHTQKVTKTRHYDPIYENHGTYPRKMLSPEYDEKIVSESRDGILSVMFNDGTQLLEHSEDDFEHFADQSLISGEHILESGLDLGKTVVNDVGELGENILDDTSSILSMPLIILAIAGGALL